MNDHQNSGDSLEKKVQVNRNAIHRLRDRIDQLERTLEVVCGDEQLQWLFRNRAERMDPTVPVFDPVRARFHLDRYEFAARFVEGKTVADIACGTGYGCQLMVAANAASVVGLDIDRRTIEYAIGKHSDERIEYRCGSANQSELESGSFDVVVSFETIEHVDDEHALFDEFARILRPGGLLICSTPNQWPLTAATHHVREYDRDSFVAALSEAFDIQNLYNQNSGSDSPFNRGQPAGIVETTDENYESAECFIAVAKRKT